MIKGYPPRIIYFLLGMSLGMVSMSLMMLSASDKDNTDRMTAILEKMDQMMKGTQMESRHTAPMMPDDQTKSPENPWRNMSSKLPPHPRILCWVMTHSKNLDSKAKAVKDTWGRRCHSLLFVSDEGNSDFPTIPVNVSKGREYLGHKTLAAFQYIYENHLEDAEWFLKSDDDTYIIMENMAHFLSSKNSEDAMYFGHHYRPWVNQGYFSGGAGYVVSVEALRRFGRRNLDAKQCQPRYGGAEDVLFGKCMEMLGVTTGETRDELGRSRFHSMDIAAHLTGNFPEWYLFYDALHGQSGQESMSDYPISFHYVTPRHMHVLEYLIYKVRVHKGGNGDSKKIPDVAQS